jgi:hypothetical protein
MTGLYWFFVIYFRELGFPDGHELGKDSYAAMLPLNMLLNHSGGVKGSFVDTILLPETLQLP